MKKITTLLVFLILLGFVQAQSPQAFKYQAVARDNAGNTINNQLVSFRISILLGSSNGTTVYSEIHQSTTNEFGLANLEIGDGSVVSGDFVSIDWSTGVYFLKVEMDVSGGSNYQLMGTSQLLSVPYALYAGNAGNAGASEINDLADGKSDPTSLFLGSGSGLNDDGSDNQNTAVGIDALKVNTTGYHNTAMGYNSLYSNSTGRYNTAFGHQTLYSSTEGRLNTAIGYRVLYSNDVGRLNTASGYLAMYSNTSGNSNVALGFRTMYSNTTGSFNIAIGPRALYLNTDRSNLVAIGDSALYNNGVGVTDPNQATGNTAVGAKALLSNAIGHNNTAIGANSLYSNSSGSYNTANGFSALYSNTGGHFNSAYGHVSLYRNITGSSNTAIGFHALYSNTTGSGNTATGKEALILNISGSQNTANGKSALAYNTVGHDNSAFGMTALYRNVDGNYNTASGYESMFYNDNGHQNTAMGRSSLKHNLSGDFNTAVGTYALRSNTIGNNNAAVGRAALFNNTTGHSNVAIGSDALFNNDVHSNLVALGDSALFHNGIGANDPENSIFNVAVGSKALYSNTKGAQNTSLGNEALFSLSDAYNNVAIGHQSLYNTLGNFNTAVGSFAGKLATGNGNIFIGYRAGYSESGSHKLYIETGSSSSPLIYGDFTSDIAAINGKLGIGTMAPSADLHVNGNAYVDTDLEVNGVAFVNTKLEIGTPTGSGYKMSVTGPSGTLVRWNRTGSDGQVLDIQNDGTYAGGISFSGGSVSYNSFTGSHIGASEKEYQYGELVSMSGENGHIEDQPENEVVYGISKSSKANDKSVLGSYLGRFDGHAESSAGSLHNIMAVGNGRMWIVDNGQDIAPGDYLISSGTLGHAMKDSGSYPVSHIIARAAQSVNWGNEYELIEGKKHKLISVTFESFEKINLLTETRNSIYIIAQEQQEKIDNMQVQIDHQGQLLQSQQAMIEDMIKEVKALKNR